MAVEEWEIDTMHSSIHFAVRHMIVAKVRGNFGRWTASLRAEGEGLDHVSLDVTIDAASIQTGFPGRDDHLKSAEFLDVHRHPHITFAGTRVERIDAAHLRLAGELTIRGVTREIVLDVEDGGRSVDGSGSERAGFTATGHVDRRDFGVDWNATLESGGMVIGNRIDIEVEVEAIKQTETAGGSVAVNAATAHVS